MNERPLLSVIVPTVGRPSLERAVNSLLRQGDWLPYEILLVGDTFAGTWAQGLERAKALAAQYPHRIRYVEHDGGLHAWGHPQRTYGATVARGRYLAWLGDDDVYTRWAFLTLAHALREREATDDPRVHLFRWIAPWKQVLWHTAGFLGEEPGHIDAECVVCPNWPGKLGTWTNRYQGDFDMIRETVDLWGGLERVIWRPEVIAQAQPTDAEDWTLGGQEVAPVRAEERVLTVLIPHVLEAVPA
jgi:Glycosyl transferase family 2